MSVTNSLARSPTNTAIHNAYPSSLDCEKFLAKTGKSFPLITEQFESDCYLEKDILKPWGNEHRVYADCFYDIWKLAILPSQSTSMHCHPRKETALLCLSGEAEVHLLDRTYRLSTGELIHIHKGAFHATENVGNSVLHLLEVETPRNKFDLVRLEDKYGRVGTKYEKETLEHKLSQLQSFPYITGAKLRRSSDSLFTFSLKGGLDLMCRQEFNFLFVVSLSLKNFFSQNIEVLPSQFTPEVIELDEFYFTIAV